MLSETIIKLLKPLSKDDVIFLQATHQLTEEVRNRILNDTKDLQCRIVLLPNWLKVVEPPKFDAYHLNEWTKPNGFFGDLLDGVTEKKYRSHNFSERTRLCSGCGIQFDSLRAYKETCQEIEKSLQDGNKYAIMADRREDERRQKNFESHAWGRNSVGRIGCRVCNTPQDEEAARLNDCQTIAGLL